MEFGTRRVAVFLLCSLVSALVYGAKGAKPAPEQSPTPAAPPHYLMAALGDSITYAFLANTRLSDFSNWPLHTHDKNWRQELEALSLWDNRSTLSWSTGAQISSQYERLQAYIHQTEPEAQIDALNLAVLGSMADGLSTQAANLAAAFNAGAYTSIKYVTVMIGSNDACRGRSDSEILTGVHEALAELAKIHQPEALRVVLVGLPRIPDLGLLPIRDSHTIGGLTCRWLQSQVLKSCESLVNFSDRVTYQKNLNYVTSRNELLAQAAAQANSEFPTLDVVFTDAPTHVSLNPSDLAIDCFHPTATAHDLLSEKVWDAQPWFK